MIYFLGAPTLHWVYVNKDTLEARHGNRTESLPNIVGPWDWTEDQEGLVLEGWEGFVAVEERADEWALYFDKNNDGLASLKDLKGKRKLSISLERKLVEEEGKT